MTTETTCTTCHRPKANRKCDVCEAALCKDCTQFLEPGTFSFFKKTPAELSHSQYCGPCFDEHVVPGQASYDEIMQRAEQAFVFFTTQKKMPPLIARGHDKLKVENCADRDETILRLAFLAAELGHNAVISAEVNSEKVRNEGYQTSRWKGIGFPATVDAEKMARWD